MDEEASSVITKVTAAEAERLDAMELEPGEKLVLISEVVVEVIDEHDAPGHVKKRTRKLRVTDVYELPGTEGRDVLRQVRNRWQLADEGARGVMQFDHSMVPAQYVATDGTVMTPAEIAEARGEKWSPDDELTVVFDDGTKAFWPDDWGAAGAHSLPGVGGFMQVPGAEPGTVRQVVRLLDPESAEPLAAWTIDDEEARELAEKAKEDRESAEAMPRPVTADEVLAEAGIEIEDGE